MNGNDRGAVLIQVAMGLLAMTALSTFVMDYGVFWEGRRQAQNAADAAAMSGAIALAYDDTTDTTGVVAQSAYSESQQNVIWGQAPSVIAASDIHTPATGYTCPGSGSGQCVRVDVYRTLARGNPLPIFFGRLVNLSTQDVKGTATAMVANGNSSNCLRPWAVADQDPNNPSQPFTVQNDYGTMAILKVGSQGQAGPGWFQALDFGSKASGNGGSGGNGAKTYEDDISGCSGVTYSVGDDLTPKNGNMVGPTSTGVDSLVAEDPNAYFCGPATSCSPPTGCPNPEGCIEGSNVEANGNAFSSPRLVPIPLYDPTIYANTGNLQIDNILGFFVVGDGNVCPGVSGNGGGNTSYVCGVLMNVPGLYVSGAGNVSNANSFIKIIQLIR